MQPWENGENPNFKPTLDPQFFFHKFYQLDIVSSYHPIQFKGKLMNQIWENGKKHNLMPDFSLNLGPKMFLRVLRLLVVRHCSKVSSMQFKGKLMNQSWENGKKPNFRPDFDQFGSNLGL